MPARPGHVPRHLARRIDRLARAAHRFHRYAHHPLCAAYAGEVFRIGRRTRVCRGCTLVVAGGATGTLAAALLPPVGVLPAVAVTLLAALVVALAARARRSRSVGKLWTRAAPAALLALASIGALRAAVAAWTLAPGRGGAVRAAPALALVLACAGVAALAIVGYRAGGPDRTPCQRCDERDGPRTCSGLVRIARREAAFSRAAARLLSAGDPR